MTPCKYCLVDLVGGEFLLHTPCWNLCYTSQDEFSPVVYLQSVSSFGKWEFILNAQCKSLSVRSAGGEFLLHAPCSNLSGLVIRRPPCSSLSVRSLRSRSYRLCAGISLVIWWCGSLFYRTLPRICLVVQRVGSLSYTPRAGFCLVIRRLGNLSYTSSARISPFFR